MKLCLAEVRAQERALTIKRSQMMSVDQYGTISASKWPQEQMYFAESRLLPLLRQNRLANSWQSIRRDVFLEMDRLTAPKIQATKQELSDARQFSATMNPLDYERLCAQILETAGWRTRLTVATGDQGADVIATKDGKTLVLQCKIYSSPVGNKAVQEVHAAKTFQQADLAAVATNAGYTPSARQLAHASGVLLLHHDELDTIAV